MEGSKYEMKTKRASELKHERKKKYQNLFWLMPRPAGKMHESVAKVETQFQIDDDDDELGD